MQTYFNVDENIQNRFFFIFGNTNDCFCDNNLIDVDLKYLLNKHLKDCGYKRIVFYSKDEKIHFYDDESFIMMKKTQEKTEASPVKKTPMLLKGPLKSRMTASSVRQPDKPAVIETSNILHFGGMTEVDAFNTIDFCMKDKNIKTAIVITNADDFIHYFGDAEISMRNKVLDSFNKYDGLGYANLNIMLFIFPSQTTASEHNENRAPVWNTFFKPKLEKRKVTEINITSPAVGEIRNAISHFRLKYGLQVDFANIDTIARRIAKEFCKDKRPLRWLMAKLKNIVENRQILDIERCDEMLGKKDNETAIQKLDKLIGMESIKEEIRALKNILKNRTEINQSEINDHTDFKSRLIPSMIFDKKRYNMHYILTGNPGTGKTTVAKLLGEIYYELGYLESGHTVKVTRDHLVAENVGGTAPKTKAKIEEAMGGVLFIDEAYSLAKGGENDFGQEAIDTLVEAMTDRNGLFAVVVAGYPKEMVDFLNKNPGLKDRFESELHIEDYTPSELFDIFNMNMRKENFWPSKNLSNIIMDFFENWYGTRDKNWSNARGVEKLISRMYKNWGLRNGEKTEEGEAILDIIDIPDDLRQHCKPTQKSKEDAMKKLNKLIGLRRVKERIEELKINIVFEGKGSTDPGHYIFAGSPGTGKTTVARLLGNILREEGVLRRGHVIDVKREDLVAGYVGQTAPKTKEKLEEAIDGILFIDEAYSLVEGGQNDYGQEAINTILAFMEDNRSRICVICAGYTKDMDRFVQSNRGLKSRFTEIIYFDDYTVEELIEILHGFGEDYIMDQDFIQKSRVIFELWIKNKGDDFGNARDVRNYFKECVTALRKRLVAGYDSINNIPEEIRKTLTGLDIPVGYILN